jgi:hypothetical protein
MASGTVMLAIAFVDELVLRAARPARARHPARSCAMNDLLVTLALRSSALFAILGSGVWIGLTLPAWPGSACSCSPRARGRRHGRDHLGLGSSWTLTALPLFVWMGEILFRTQAVQDMFRGLAPWMQGCPGGCCTPTSSAAPSSPPCRAQSAATCATIGKMTCPS